MKLPLAADVGMKWSFPRIHLVVHPSHRPSVHPSGRPCESTPRKLQGCRPQTIPLLSVTLQLSAHQDILKDVGMKWSYVPSSVPSSIQTEQIYFLKREKTRKKWKQKNTLTIRNFF
jgi:hypothetical protein